MGGWIESRVYRVTDRNNLKYKFLDCAICFQGAAWCGKGAIFECFSASLEKLLALISGDVGVGCKMLAEVFVGLSCVAVFSIHWWCRGEELSPGF